LDAEGRAVPLEKSDEIPAGLSVDRAALGRYLVRNSGRVLVNWRLDTAELIFSGTALTVESLARILLFLTTERPSRVLLRELDRSRPDNVHGILGDCQMAMRWARKHSHQLMGGDTPFLSRRRSPAECGVHPRFRKAIAHWAHSGGRLRPDETRQLALETLKQRYVKLEVVNSGDSIIIDSFGANVPTFAKRWLAAAVGTDFARSPDRRYVERCRATFSEASRSFAPEIDDVDAIVFWPGQGYQRRQYQRLILPFREAARNGRSWILSATLPDHSIDLRRAAD
jgi:hypothetical protein